MGIKDTVGKVSMVVGTAASAASAASDNYVLATSTDSDERTQAEQSLAQGYLAEQVSPSKDED